MYTWLYYWIKLNLVEHTVLIPAYNNLPASMGIYMLNIQAQGSKSTELKHHIDAWEYMV